MRGAQLWLGTSVEAIRQVDGLFEVATSRGTVRSKRLVVATGGRSIPKMGATGLGYEIAAQFGLGLVEPLSLIPI